MGNNSSMEASKEIDLIDFFWDWISHWKSLIVFILIGCVLGVVLMITAPKTTTTTTEPTTEESSTTETKDIKDVDWENYLGEGTRLPVEQLANNYKAYLEMVDLYNTNKSRMTSDERAAMLKDITETEYYIGTIKKDFSYEQSCYFNYLNDIPGNYSVTRTETITIPEEVIETPVPMSALIKKFIIAVIILIILHIVVFVIRYVLSSKLKVTDSLAAMLGCVEFSRVINWEAIDSKSKIDRAICKARLKKWSGLAKDEALSVNASSIADIAAKNNIRSIAIVSDTLTAEAEELKAMLQKENAELSITCVNGLSRDAYGAKAISNAEGAVLLAKMNQSRTIDMLENRQALIARDITLIGAVAYI